MSSWFRPRYLVEWTSTTMQDSVIAGVTISVSIPLILAVISYIRTRPWVKIIATKDTILYGSRKFSRLHYGGMRIGYTTKEDGGLKNSFFDLSLGMAAPRLQYGRWGEDLAYLVNGYHANEIVIWLNEIIDSVGAPPPPKYDAYAGRKPELL